MKKIYFSLAVLVLATLACQLFSGPATQVPPSNRTILYQDDFSDSNSGWPVTSDASKSASYTADGRYQLTALEAQQDIWAHPGQSFSDVSLEVDAVKAGGSDNNNFGLICRFVDDGNFYFFWISSDGYQVIGKYQGGQATFLSAEKMQSSSAIQQGAASNHLRADCVGSSLTLYVNGTQVASASDTSFSKGDVGVMIGTFDEPNVAIAFDNFVAYQP
ncbi:MAG: hypothetical protein ACP5QU_00455 [Anaerolineae bacterium]